MCATLPVRTSFAPTPSGRPIYIAVTVPEDLGVGDRVVMEGLARRIMPEPVGNQTLNISKATRMMYEEYRYRGILEEEKRAGSQGWEPDTEVYKGPGPTVMVRNNYAGILSQMSLGELERGNFEESLLAMGNAETLVPNSVNIAMGKGYLFERQGQFRGCRRTLSSSCRQVFPPPISPWIVEGRCLDNWAGPRTLSPH